MQSSAKKKVMRIVVVVLWWSLGSVIAAPPVVPGLLHVRHGLDAAGQGRLLIEELRCAGCHAGPVQRKLGPDLSGVGARVDAGYLHRFLLDPQKEDPGTQMPDVLAAVSADEREATADMLTCLLYTSPSPRDRG